MTVLSFLACFASKRGFIMASRFGLSTVKSMFLSFRRHLAKVSRARASLISRRFEILAPVFCCSGVVICWGVQRSPSLFVTPKNPKVLSKSKATCAIPIGLSHKIDMSRTRGVKGRMDTLPPHELTPEALKYIESMTPEQRQLHELAIRMLGSSYFVERTRGFEKYKERRK